MIQTFWMTFKEQEVTWPLTYLQVIEPTQKDQGKYSIVIVDPENSHQRRLDLSGEGAALSASHHLHTPRQPVQSSSFPPFQVWDARPCWLRRSWELGKVLLRSPQIRSCCSEFHWVDENMSALLKEHLKTPREPPFLYIKWPPSSSRYLFLLPRSPSGAFFLYFCCIMLV